MTSTDASLAHPVRSALVVLEDGQRLEVVTRHLEQAGVANVVVRYGGNKAWDAALSFPFDLVISGWRLAGFSGLALFNRLRQTPVYQLTPILVVTESVTPEEFSLLREYPSTRLLNKVLTNEYFTQGLTSAAEEAGWYRSHAAQVESLIDFAERDVTKALALLKTSIAKAPDPTPLTLLVGRKLRENGFLPEAEAVLRDQLRRTGDSDTVALSELGKVLHQRGMHAAAAETLNRAQALSPKNVARLCLLGEIDLTLANPSAALSRFARVLEIDEGNLVGKAGVQIIKDQRDKPVGFASVNQTLASMLNVGGIGSVRQKRFAEGIESYSAALNLASAVEARAKLCLNLGLGYLRWGKYAKALEWLRLAGDLAVEPYQKAERYARTAEERLRQGDGGEGALDIDADITDHVSADLKALQQVDALIEEEALFT